MDNKTKADPEQVLHNQKAAVHNGVATAPAILSTAQLAAGGAAVSGVIEPIGGLLNYVITYIANRKIRKITMPITDDLALMKLDRKALAILESRLQHLKDYAPTMEEWRAEKEDPKKIYDNGMTLWEMKQATLNVYDRLKREDSEMNSESLPFGIKKMTTMLDNGGKRKLSEDEESDVCRTINTSARLFKFWDGNLQDIDKWERSLDNDEWWQCLTESMEMRNMKTAKGCQCSPRYADRPCPCIEEAWAMKQREEELERAHQ